MGVGVEPVADVANHASVITGFDKNTIFVNDPYGYKNRKVPRKIFEQIFTSLGSQSLYLV
ncbi:hypothetical protein IGJ66_000482 [Enterococcus sp. DIV0176]|uniref:hypothetical protein n=1 Tax=Enterococcus sp. DIV0176 TaxID=2774758 RepID=UPI003D2FDEB4